MSNFVTLASVSVAALLASTVVLAASPRLLAGSAAEAMAGPSPALTQGMGQLVKLHLVSDMQL